MVLRHFVCAVFPLCLCVVPAAAGPIAVPNASFESPAIRAAPYATSNIADWQKAPVPGWWASQGYSEQQWLETAGVFYNVPGVQQIDNVDGEQAAFLFATPAVELRQDLSGAAINVAADEELTSQAHLFNPTLCNGRLQADDVPFGLFHLAVPFNKDYRPVVRCLLFTSLRMCQEWSAFGFMVFRSLSTSRLSRPTRIRIGFQMLQWPSRFYGCVRDVPPTAIVSFAPFEKPARRRIRPARGHP